MTPATPKDIADAAKISLEVVDKLVGYAQELQGLFGKVVSMPRRALLDLEEIFDEVEKSLGAVDIATKDFFNAVQDPAKFIDDDDLMHDMSSARLPALVEEKRGHCHEIGNIYYRYLSGILSNLFQDEAKRMRAEEILNQLHNADDDLFKELTRAAKKMRDVAKEVYRLKILGKREDAMENLRSTADPLLDMRGRFTDAAIEMSRVKSEFVKAARVAPA